MSALMLVAAPGSASIAQGTVASQVPSSMTPHAVDDDVVANAEVRTFTQVGSYMYAGGSFHTVENPARTKSRHRDNLFSFHIDTGEPTGWAPDVNGEVYRVLHIASYLYVGGAFTSADGVKGHLVRYRLGSGDPRIDRSWSAEHVTRKVTDLDRARGRLLVAGSFRRHLVALDPDTGRDTGYIKLDIAGTVKQGGAGPTQVYRIAVGPGGGRLMAIGNFTTVGSAVRRRAFMLLLQPKTATLSAWYYAPLMHPCKNKGVRAYLRDVDFSPGGRYFVLVSSGLVPTRADRLGTDVCDAAARFEVGKKPHPARPTWINYTGGDTLHSVAVTGAAVYVGGHQRWLDNPRGVNSPGPGAVSRPGVGAINPATGKALAWNPTKTRGVGTKVIYATRTGVWFGSDGRRFGGEIHDSIAFTPLS